MYSRLYVSRATLDIADRVSKVEEIIATSVMRNRALNITGVLVTTPDYFAQYLEGPQEQVEFLCHRIAEDPRHRDPRFAPPVEIRTRKFADQPLARLNAALFGDRAVTSAMAAAHAQGGRAAPIGKLDRLIDAISLGNLTVG